MFRAIQRVILPALVLIMLSACTNSEEQNEKNRIQQTTEKIAHDAVRSIKTPIEKAELAKNITEQRNDAIKKNVNKQ